jgi:ankyrin repeat protein
VEILLRNRASVSVSDAMEENALHKAAAQGHFAILNMLLDSLDHIMTINDQNVLGSLTRSAPRWLVILD